MKVVTCGMVFNLRGYCVNQGMNKYNGSVITNLVLY